MRSLSNMMPTNGSGSSHISTVKNTVNSARTNVSVLGKNTVDGIRLKNPRFYCFLNTAINTVITSEKLMDQLLNEDALKVWGEQILLVHDPNFVEGTERSYGDILNSLNVLSLDLTGCSIHPKNHGEGCFESVKSQIKAHLLKSNVLKELKRLVFEEIGVRDATILRMLLVKSFPIFTEDVQHDAADAYLSIIECLPDAKMLCSLKLRKNRVCIECNNIDTTDDSNEWCMMLNYRETTVRTLQEAVDEWCNTTSRIDYECNCKHLSVIPNPTNTVEMYYT